MCNKKIKTRASCLKDKWRDIRFLTGGVINCDSKLLTSYAIQRGVSKKGSRLEDKRASVMMLSKAQLCRTFENGLDTYLELCDVSNNALGQGCAVDTVVNCDRGFLAGHFLNHQSGCGDYLLVVFVWEKNHNYNLH